MNNRTKKKSKKKSPGGINRTYGRQAAEFADRKPSFFNPQINKGAAHRQDAEVINNYFSPDGVNDPQGVAMGGRRRRKKTRRKMRRKTRRKKRRKTRKRRGKRGRKTRRRRGGVGFRNSPPLKGIKKPYDCSEEKKEIERLRQELALRTPPRPKRPAQSITPGSPSPRSNPFHDDYEGTPSSVPHPSPLARLRATAAAPAGRRLFNNDDSPRTPADQRLRSPSPPITPKRGGRRRRRTRRTRKKRRKGGMFKKKKKKPQPRPFEEMMGFPPTPEQQRAAAKEAESYEHIPSAAEVAGEIATDVKFSKIKPRRRTTYTEHVDAVASTIRGLKKAPERRKTMMMMTEDTITKLKKILEKTESKSSRKYLKEKIKKLEELVRGLVPEPGYTFIDYDEASKAAAKNTHF